MSDDSGLPAIYDGPGYEDGGDSPTEVDAPTESGQGGETVTTEEAPSVAYLSDEFDGYVTKIVIDGEEIEVPVSELRQGYSRHSDYTRKTQELAAEKQQLQWERAVREGLATDPANTIAYLQSQFLTSPQSEPEVEWPEDPMERALLQQRMEFQQQLEPLKRAYAAQDVERTVGALQARYGEDFNPNEVIAEAVRRGYDDPRALESVYKEMAFDRMRATSEAQQMSAAQRTAANTQKVDAKSQIVSHGGSAVVSPPATPSQYSTLEESFEAALRQHGVKR